MRHAVLLLALLLGASAVAQDEIVPRDWLVIAPVDDTGRRPFRPDAVFARHLLDRDSPPPVAGETLTGERGEQTWERREADENGRVAAPVGYAYTAIESDTDRVMIADVRSALTVFVNGSAHMADLYGYGFGGVPVALHEGTNHVYVHVRRGRGFSMTLREPEAELLFVAADVTVPDLVAGVPYAGGAAVLVMNASTQPITLTQVTSGGRDGFSLHEREGFLADRSNGRQRLGFDRPVTTVPPLGVDKILIPIEWDGRAAVEPGDTLSLPITLAGDSASWAGQLELAVRGPAEARRVTFSSPMDDSTQQYAVLPPSGDVESPGLVLSLHGAGVDCLAQARAYSPKDDLWIVAPTNRRPFGFDWQDWGAKDAFEVLSLASQWIEPDWKRLYLTGHSMGGHGTWNLAVNHPGVFAAIAPSAGWPSFDTYGGRPEGRLTELWHRADARSDTLALLPNLGATPVFIVHGTGDDNVPLEQAKIAEQALVELGHPPSTHYEEGAGHWWDGEAAAGADCVDWPGIFELFASSALTERGPWKPVPVSAGQGPFKQAFDQRFALVYGTQGTEEETRESFERARMDAQAWWYRGNGRAPIVSDVEFESTAWGNLHWSVILYGNAETNGAWDSLVGADSPIQVTRDSVRIGDHHWAGDDLGCVFVRPRREGQLVGVVANTGLQGARLGYTHAYFVSGVGYPDYAAFSSKVLQEGDGGVLAAGFYDQDWVPDGQGFVAAPEER